MSRPGLLLLVLVILAGLAGRVLTNVHRGNTARPAPLSASPDSPADAPAEENSTEESADPASVSSSSSPPPTPSLDQGGGSRAAIEGALLNEAYQISKARALTYQDALNFQPGTEAALQQTWQRQIATRFPSDSLNRLGLALQVTGILPSDEDLAARYRLFPNPSPSTLYDPLENQLLHSEHLTTEDPATREWVAIHLLLMLLSQNFGWYEQFTPAEVNWDRALAEQAFVLGDAVLHAARHTETDIRESQAWRKLTSITERWPAPFSDAEMLPLREGVHFCQAVSGQNVALDSIYQQLPDTTSHLLHSDRYLEIPRWQPRRLEWAQLDLRQSEPVWENVMGELMIRAWLRAALGEESASALASGWEGDGVLLYQTDDEAPQLVWKSAWRDSGSAQRFFETLGEHAGRLFEMEETTGRRDGNTWTFDGVLTLSLTLAEDTVTMVRSTEPEWAAALTDLGDRSSFIRPSFIRP